MKNKLDNYCELHWWNFGKKTLSFKGKLKDLVKEQKIKIQIRKTETEGIYIYTFSNPFGITFRQTGVKDDLAHLAKQFIQMELVRMGDKSKLYVSGAWRPTVTVNF